MAPYCDPASERFVLPLESVRATVNYWKRADGVVEFRHVYVPPDHRGTDASRRVLGFAFSYAREQGWRVRPICPYIAGRYVPRHPEIHDLISER
ncbi:MAG: GNAT family N-acetyltransferase [Planctomycetota bacterium]